MIWAQIRADPALATLPERRFFDPAGAASRAKLGPNFLGQVGCD